MLLSDRDKSYIYDMIKYCREVIEIASAESHQTFINNRVKRLAIERLIEVVGEAANHISNNVMVQNDDIPWAKIIGLRNKLAHDYGEILTDRIWLIATVSIPELLMKIELKKFI